MGRSESEKRRVRLNKALPNSSLNSILFSKPNLSISKGTSIYWQNSKIEVNSLSPSAVKCHKFPSLWNISLHQNATKRHNSIEGRYKILSLTIKPTGKRDRKCVRCAYCLVDVYSNIEDCKYFNRKKHEMCANLLRTYLDWENGLVRTPCRFRTCG